MPTTDHPALGRTVIKPLPPSPPAPHPQPKPITRHGLLVKATAAGRSAVAIAGAQVKDLIVHGAPSDDAADPDEFVAKGKIDLFGNKSIPAEFAVWYGHPPPGVTIGSAIPSIERATIDGPVKLSQLFPSLRKTSLGAGTTLQDVSIYHQNYLYDRTKDLGYDLDADLIIGSSPGLLSSTLSNVLAINKPTLHVHANLGPDLNWSDAPDINTLVIEGSFRYAYTATPGVQITNVGVRLILGHDPDKAATYDIEIFGKLNLTIPGMGALPMELGYTLKELGGTVHLMASLPSGVTWADPMGVQGFVLNPVTFSCHLPPSDPWKGLKLDIAAQFRYQTTIVKFTGSYAPGGACSLHADIEGFNLASCQQLYEAVQHESLKTPGVDVTIKFADLAITSEDGFSATLTDVNIAGYGSGNAVLHFSSAGFVVQAKLGTVQFGEVTVNTARVELDLQPVSSSKSSSATIYGDITFGALRTDVAVHLYPSAPGVVPKRTEWTVYAGLTAADNTLALSKLDPRLKGTDFDLALKSVVFIAASQNDPDVGTYIPSAYTPREGVQVFATLDKIPVFNSLTKSDVSGMVLQACWSQATGFSLNVLLPVARGLTLGDGITTTPVSLSLDMIHGPIDTANLIPCLQVSAGLNIPVARSPKPLLFQMSLTATDMGATIAANLKGNWVDPFGVGKEVVVGPELTLGASFGYESGLDAQFGGGLAVGKTTAKVTVGVNEDPLQELLSAKIKDLNFTDVVSFAEKLLDLRLPPPPRDFLQFEKLDLYICPVGLIFGEVVYPAGFSFKSDMILFGTRVDVSCGANETLLWIKASVGNFHVGPLKVGGLDGKKEACLNVQVGEDIQHLLVDGAVNLYAAMCGLHFRVDTQPEPEISFKIEFQLTELLKFKVNAKLIGAPNFKDLSNADFTFDALLEQRILDYVHDELLKLLTRAQQAEEEGIEAAKKRLASDQASSHNRIAEAQAVFQLARDKWKAHRKSVMETNSKVIQDYQASVKIHENAIASAKRALDAAHQKTQTALTAAKNDRQVKMWAAQDNLENVKRKVLSAVDEAKAEAIVLQRNMSRLYGFAEDNVETARRRVTDLENQLNAAKRQLQYPLVLIFSEREQEERVAMLQEELWIAQQLLSNAEAVVKSVDYVKDKTLVEEAQKDLELAQRAVPMHVGSAETMLRNVHETTQKLVDELLKELGAMQNWNEKSKLASAQAVLAAHEFTYSSLFELAKTAIAGLDKSVEYFGYEISRTVVSMEQSAARILDATAEDFLTGVEDISAVAFDVCKAIVDTGTEALDITYIHVSGKLSDSVRGDALKAHVKGMVLGHCPIEFRVDLNPTKVEDFVGDLFNELMDKLGEIHL